MRAYGQERVWFPGYGGPSVLGSQGPLWSGVGELRRERARRAGARTISACSARRCPICSACFRRSAFADWAFISAKARCGTRRWPCTIRRRGRCFLPVVDERRRDRARAGARPRLADGADALRSARHVQHGPRGPAVPRPSGGVDARAERCRPGRELVRHGRGPAGAERAPHRGVRAQRGLVRECGPRSRRPDERLSVGGAGRRAHRAMERSRRPRLRAMARRR